MLINERLEERVTYYPPSTHYSEGSNFGDSPYGIIARAISGRTGKTWHEIL